MKTMNRINERYDSGRGRPGAQPGVIEWTRSRADDYYRTKLSRWLPAEPSSSILDLGCGQGRWLAFLLERGYPAVTGVDINPAKTARARELAPSARIIERDMLEFLSEQTAGAYDCVTALDVIEHLEKDQVIPFLDHLYRVLRPGGRVILQTPNGASPWGMAVRYGDFAHGCCFTPVSLAVLLARAGFADFQAQETGPVRRGISGSVRWVLWRLLVWFNHFHALVETGRIRELGIYTRVFQCSARKSSVPAESGR
jgi:2-polyprenyl-3-methyl-5-hydroxy-6-metoxy-1,4-benzoquinol methylase